MKANKKFKQSDKQIILDYLYLLKSFANNNLISEISEKIIRTKRKQRKNFQEAFFLSFFVPNENSDKSDSKVKLFINEKTSFKYRNRITLSEINCNNNKNIPKNVSDNVDEILENNTSDKSLVNDKIDIEVKKENKFNSDFTGKKKKIKCKDTEMKNYKKRKTTGILKNILEEDN